MARGMRRVIILGACLAVVAVTACQKNEAPPPAEAKKTEPVKAEPPPGPDASTRAAAAPGA